MGRFGGILIVSDVDGTFIARGGAVVERNIKALEYFLSEGGHFTFATGRDHIALLSVVPMAAELANAPAINANGGYLYSFRKKEMINPTYLPEQSIKNAVDFVYDLNDSFGIRYSALDGSKYCRRAVVEPSYADAPLLLRNEWCFRNCFKVVIRGLPEALDALRPILEEKFGEELSFVKSSATLLEMVPHNVNKGHAVKSLREYFAALGQEVKVYACGDNENDIEMLLAADVAVCPSNAIDKVKEISHHTLCSSGEGLIADLIEMLK